MKSTGKKKIIVASTGASGAVLGIRLLEELRRTDAEVFAVWSQMAQVTLMKETGKTLDELRSLSDHWYEEGDLAAPISSGSFPVDAMAVIPCSMKTLSALANGFSYNLIARAADVMLKERRRLVLGVRETPLSSIHLRNMLAASEAGAMIMPPCMSFYCRPENLEEMVDQYIARVMDALQVRHALSRRWMG